MVAMVASSHQSSNYRRPQANALGGVGRLVSVNQRKSSGSMRFILDPSEHTASQNESRAGHKKRFTPKIRLAALLLISGALVGQTFAADITINSQQAVEFGQGLSVYTSCAGDTALNLVPESNFVNGGTSGSFFLKSVSVSNVPASCAGLDLTLNVHDSNGDAVDIYGTNQESAVAYFNGTNFTKGPGTGYSVTGSGSSFTMNFTSPVAISSSARFFTLQTGEHTPLTCLNGGTCSLGDTGPGGGTIFFVSAGTFSAPGTSCGASCKYLEYAPRNWGDGIPVASGESSGTATSWPALKWCTGNGATNAVTSIVSRNEAAMMTSTFGAGFNATSAIGANCASGAGRTVNDLVFGGVSDWFLPSFSEMHQLCKYIRGSSGVGTITTTCAGGSLPALFPNTHYWTSTESDETPGQAAWLFFLGTPDPDDDLKGYAGRTVPIRAFA